MRSPRNYKFQKLPGLICLIALCFSALLGLSGHASSYSIDRSLAQIDRLDQGAISKLPLGPQAQDFVPPESLRLPKLESVGYIRGLNDSLPEILTKVGLDVEEIEATEIARVDLQKYSAILVGPYAYSLAGNTEGIESRLLSFVQQGGLLLTQNQTGEYLGHGFVPHPFRQRLSAEMEGQSLKIGDPGHKAFNFPNRLDDVDLQQLEGGRSRFELDSWDPAYQQLTLASDGKAQTLLADHGEGFFLYSTYPFSSEIQIGNSAAMRLLVNLISLQTSERKGEIGQGCKSDNVEYGYQSSNGTFSNFGCDGAPRNC